MLSFSPGAVSGWQLGCWDGPLLRCGSSSRPSAMSFVLYCIRIVFISYLGFSSGPETLVSSLLDSVSCSCVGCGRRVDFSA